jgi:hypothetical protein
VSDTGFLLNLSFPAEPRHADALQDVIVQAVRQAGGDEARARDFAGRVADVARESAGRQPREARLTVKLELGPPIQAIVGGRTLKFENPAEAGRRDNPAKAGLYEPE